VAAVDMEADTAVRSVAAATVVVAAVIATTALTVEAQATEAVDSPDTAMVEVEAHMAEAMALRLRRPTVVAHSLLLPQSPPLLNLPPQQ
jgi:hypothetical protein